MPEPILFYSRCKPWGVNLKQIAVAHRRLFIGYPMLRPNQPYRPEAPETCLISPEGGEEWEEEKKARKKTAPFTGNARLVAAASVPGSIGMIPDPSRGRIYCGEIQAFSIRHDPALFEDALRLFEKAEKPDGSRQPSVSDEPIRVAAEIAQGWSVERFVEVPFPMMPAWIRAGLFGRRTYSIIKPDAEVSAATPVEVVRALMAQVAAGVHFQPLAWTTEPSDVARRLLDHVTPSLFESLIVSLLQLDQPDLSWIGVGGSGDGGVDGIAWDASGRVTAVLQCKWKYDGRAVFEDALVFDSGDCRPREVLAFVRGPKPTGDYEVYDLDRIVEAMIRHAQRLPLAVTLKIGADQA